MNFSKIDLYGFKSFADKLEIKFDGGITGIVGPNGCGKSNVADAIRWVLGEQSAKTLRGGSMQDVIFNGTQNRKSLSYCEVSLYFDNTNRMFTLDFNEVVITRKLYRSGESEYYINKNISRLKDIIELLHECGIGKEGYSIIGQGKIDEILSAKPEDRRAIFEEATGIAKFKAKKLETERKLERTRENIVRYVDILTELERQLEPLSRQSAAAKRFVELSEELKFNEINTYVHKYDSANDVKNRINIKLNAINEESQLRQSEYDKAQGDYDSNLNEIRVSDGRIQELRDELLNKSVGYEQQMSNIKVFNERKSSLLTQTERIKENVENLKNRLAELSSDKTAAENKKADNEKLLKQLSEDENKLNRQLMKLIAEISKGEEENTKNQKKVIESLESLSDIKAGISSLSTEKAALSSQRQEIASKTGKITGDLSQLKAEEGKLKANLAEKAASKNAVSEKIRALENSLNELNGTIRKLSDQIYELNGRISAASTKENFLLSLKDSFEGYQFPVKKLMQAAKDDKKIESKIKGVVAGVIKTDQKCEVAIETALGASAQNIITDNPDDAKYLIEYLKLNKLGRVTFLPVTSIKPRNASYEAEKALSERGVIGLADRLVSYDKYFLNVVSSLLGNTVICDTLDNAVEISKKYRFAFKIVTLEGDVFSTQGSMTGGSKKAEAGNLLATDRELDNVRAETAKMKEAFVRLTKEKQNAEAKHESAVTEIENLEKNVLSLNAQIAEVNEKIAVSLSGADKINQEITALNSENGELLGRIEKINAKIEIITGDDEKLKSDKEAGEKTARQKQEEFDNLRKLRDKTAEDNTQLKVKIAALQSEISSFGADSFRIADEVKEINKTIEKENESIESIKKYIDEINLSIEKQALSESEQKELNDLREKINEFEYNKNLLNEKMAKADLARQELTKVLAQLSEKKHEQEMAFSRVDIEIENMQEKIWEDYQCSYETAVKMKDENYDLTKSAGEIGRLKKAINGLGPINPNAITDFEDVNSRHKEMSVQKDDLLKGEEDLKTAIAALTNEMLVKFNEGFVHINENFVRAFKELFGGGNAKLVLEDSETGDPLDAGIEIIAEPPGKKLQKISLLSGGERALTAIAILFGILKLRPMPFCVLDEIEAALDEANVDRFARYLKNFSKETQFIVITHRKPTMELADSLYGVTMEEKGVSKMVSVKLSDVVDTLGK